MNTAPQAQYWFHLTGKVFLKFPLAGMDTLWQQELDHQFFAVFRIDLQPRHKRYEQRRLLVVINNTKACFTREWKPNFGRTQKICTLAREEPSPKKTRGGKARCYVP
jgi:hypothetical protein